MNASPMPVALYGKNLPNWVEATLRAQFHPTSLEVIDESHQHAGHAGRIGAAPDQVTHLRLRIAAPLLSTMTRVVAHRAINEALKPAFEAGLHALAMEIVR